MEKQITIIIPTYNMEKYIGRCLDSLLIPEFDQVEVLVINDGSKDRSSEIAHTYADRYPDSFRVIDKPNGNYGSCINAAIPQATGRYVKILDADDSFDKTGFSAFVRNLQNVDVDVIVSEYLNCYQNGESIAPNNWYLTKLDLAKELKAPVFFSYIREENIQMHRLAYKLSFLKSINYRQTEGISYTDTEWVYLPLFRCNSAVYYDTEVYRYTCDRVGQSMSPEKLQSSLKQLFKILEIISLFYQSNILRGVSKDAFVRMASNTFTFVYSKAFEVWSTEVAQIVKAFDPKLKTLFPEMYSIVGLIRYHPRCRFYHFTDIRRKAYPSQYSIPTWVKLMISVRNLLNI